MTTITVDIGTDGDEWDVQVHNAQEHKCSRSADGTRDTRWDC